jgi:hypothetical protein
MFKSAVDWCNSFFNEKICILWNIFSDGAKSLKSPKNGGGDGARNLDKELRGTASADQNAISVIEKNIDSDHEICQCKCMKKFDSYMEARNITNMFVYN